MRLPSWLTPHSVLVRPYEGEGSNGPVFGEPVRVDHVYVEDVHDLVFDDSGAQVVSRGKVFFNLDAAPSQGSLVTTWPGSDRERESVAFRVAVFDHPNAASHAVAYLR